MFFFCVVVVVQVWYEISEFAASLDDLSGIIASGRGNKGDTSGKTKTGEVLEIKCKCGSLMQIMTAKSVYGDSYTECKECEEYIDDRDYMFHCPQGKNSTHKEGYDACYNCGIKRKTQKEKGAVMLLKKQTMRILPRVRALSMTENASSVNDTTDNDGSILYNSLYLMAEDRIQIQKLKLKKEIDAISHQTAWKQMIRYEQPKEDRVKQRGNVSLRQDSSDYVTFANKLGMFYILYIVFLVFGCTHLCDMHNMQ